MREDNSLNLTKDMSIDWQEWDQLNEKYNAGNPKLDSRFVKKLLEFYPEKSMNFVKVEINGYKVFVILYKSSFIQLTCFKPDQLQIAVLLAPSDKNIIAILFRKLPLYIWKIDIHGLDPKFQQGHIESNCSDNQVASTNLEVTASNFDNYWQSRSGKLRKNITRSMRQISESNLNYRFEVVQSTSKIENAVDEFAKLESKGWKGKQGTALHPSNKQGQFYRETLKLFSLKNQSIVFNVYINEELGASKLCLFNANMLIINKTTHNEKFAEYGIGRLLLMDVIKYVLDNNLCNTIEFYTAADKVLAAWGTSERLMINKSYYRNRFIYSIFMLLKFIRRQLQT